MRDWYNQPDESKSERVERYDMLLALRHQRLKEGESLTVAQIAECSGMHHDSVAEVLERALLKAQDHFPKNIKNLPALLASL